MVSYAANVIAEQDLHQGSAGGVGVHQPPLDTSTDDGADVANMASSDDDDEEEEEEDYVVESIKEVGIDEHVCIIILYEWNPLTQLRVCMYIVSDGWDSLRMRIPG